MEHFWYRVSAMLACLATLAAAYMTWLFTTNSFLTTPLDELSVVLATWGALWTVSCMVMGITYFLHENVSSILLGVMVLFGPIALFMFFCSKILSGKPLNSDCYAKDLVLHWPGVKNRLMTMMILGGEVFVIVYSVAWAMGKVPPEMAWYSLFRWWAALLAVWIFSTIVYYFKDDQSSSTGFFELLLGPIHVVPACCGRLISGEPINQDMAEIVPFFTERTEME